ncbi:MAG: DUF3429 domain-containing protein [Gammaproteobacteria bacterium]|nr:DUF3429 domain-containing protein [Gammaproteobacteria bacterium]
MYQNTDPQLATRIILTCLGFIPFVAATCALVVDITLFGFHGAHIFITYAAIIVSFLAGSTWGLFLLQQASKRKLILTNVIALIAWWSLFTEPSFLAFGLLAVSFWLINQMEQDTPGVPDGYLRLRRVATWLIVALSIVQGLMA